MSSHLWGRQLPVFDDREVSRVEHICSRCGVEQTMFVKEINPVWFYSSGSVKDVSGKYIDMDDCELVIVNTVLAQ